MRMRLIAQTLLDSQYLIYNGYVRDREGEGGGEMCKPPAIRIRATLIFWKNGTYIGRSIQIGSSKMVKLVSILSMLTVLKAASRLIQCAVNFTVKSQYACIGQHVYRIRIALGTI